MLLRVHYTFSPSVLQQMAIDNIKAGEPVKAIDFDMDDEHNLRQCLALYNPKVLHAGGFDCFNNVYGQPKLFMVFYNKDAPLMVDAGFDYDLRTTICCMVIANLMAQHEMKELQNLKIKNEKSSIIIKNGIVFGILFLILFLISFVSAIFYVQGI